MQKLRVEYWVLPQHLFSPLIFTLVLDRPKGASVITAQNVHLLLIYGTGTNTFFLELFLVVKHNKLFHIELDLVVKAVQK